jgi:hypothetical protein
LILEPDVGDWRVTSTDIGFNVHVHRRATSLRLGRSAAVATWFVALSAGLIGCGDTDDAGPNVPLDISPTVAIGVLPDALSGSVAPPEPPTTRPAATTTTIDPSAPTATTEPVEPIGQQVSGNRVLMIGDSLLASTAPQFGGPMCEVLGKQGWSVAIEAEQSQFVPFGDVVLDERLEKSDAPEWDAAAIFLGNNFDGDVVKYTLRMIDYLKRLAPRPTMLFTMTEVDDDHVELNRRIRDLAASNELVVVIDWATVSAADPDLLTSDGVHLAEAGKQRLAELTAAALGRAPDADEVKCLKTIFAGDGQSNGSSGSAP